MRHFPLCGRLAWLAWFLLAVTVLITIEFQKNNKKKRKYLSTCNSIFPNFPSNPKQRYHAVNCRIDVEHQTNTTVTLLLRTTQVPFMHQNTTIPIAEYHNLTICYINIYTGITIIIPNPCVDAGHLNNTLVAIMFLYIFYMFIIGWVIIALGYNSKHYEENIAYQSERRDRAMILQQYTSI